jgi:hypothetical protein
MVLRAMSGRALTHARRVALNNLWRGLKVLSVNKNVPKTSFIGAVDFQDSRHSRI